jgi:hypothetical protein
VSERNQRKQDSVYSKTVRAGKRRTYFFDVKQTKGNDYYLTITESKKAFEEGNYQRHKIFLYKEDFNRFVEGLNEAVEYIKNDLMPDYDYDEYARRQEEYLLRKEEEDNENENEDRPKRGDIVSSISEIEEDLAW